MKNRFKFIIGILLFLSFGFTSCNSWLDVQPSDRVTEEQLFSDLSGFKTGLNGLYSEMNSGTLYGHNLTNGMMDVMGQYYNCNIETHSQLPALGYNYTHADLERKLGEIWTKMYFLIANTNLLLENCDKQTDILSINNYRLIKGEALALRAMFHFDLLRMFGPLWSEDTKVSECIPYMTSSKKEIQPFLTAQSILELAIKDLQEASELLQLVDPVVTQNSVNSDEVWLNNRQFRMNYYAVNGLLARAYLWSNDKINALKHAELVIQNTNNKESGLFKFVSSDYIQGSEDLMFFPEVIFGCYNSTRASIFNSQFEYSVGITASLRPAGESIASGRVKSMYDDLNDERYKQWGENIIEGQNRISLLKYRTKQSTDTYFRGFSNAVIPLLRISELYLIAAECTTDISKAYSEYINPVRFARTARNLNGESEVEKQKHIQAEFCRELIGEGQMFYYFKRLALTNIPDAKTTDKTMNMDLNNYVFPIPKSETDQR
ncbi:MAG: RagB/SusD family nutrient uptake outer membrane protein [Marinifilaceae bacterium]